MGPVENKKYILSQSFTFKRLRIGWFCCNCLWMKTLYSWVLWEADLPAGLAAELGLAVTDMMWCKTGLKRTKDIRARVQGQKRGKKKEEEVWKREKKTFSFLLSFKRLFATNGWSKQNRSSGSRHERNSWVSYLTATSNVIWHLCPILKRVLRTNTYVLARKQEKKKKSFFFLPENIYFIPDLVGIVHSIYR